jgi:hypothetical protein
LTGDERVTGEPAPRGNVFGRAGVAGDETQHLARAQSAHAHPQLQYQITAAGITGIPDFIGASAHPRNLGKNPFVDCGNQNGRRPVE